MARLGNKRIPLVPLLVAALAAIVLLATLQYRWVGEVSQGYRERMQDTLQTGMAHFSEEFDRELAHIYLSFRMDASTLETRDWSRYAQRYERWSATASYPRLAESVYLLQIYDDSRMSIAKYDPATGMFMTQPWPDSLAGLHERLRSASAGTGEQGGFSLPRIIDDAPAIAIPLSRNLQLSDQQELDVQADIVFGDDVISQAERGCWRCVRRDTPSVPRSAYTIVTLNQQYLVDEFVPDLAQRHFANGGALDYYLAIVDRHNPEHVIYRSDPRMTDADIAAGDTSVPILSVRLDAFSALLLNTSLRATDDPGNQSERVMIGVLGQSDEQDGRWQLVLKHRVGSLEAAVSELRVRNMLISFSTLLLLFVSVAMIVVSTRRAQRLARQQMEFVAAVSHELRTPLAVICSAGENLSDGVVQDPRQTRQYGAVIHSEGRRLAEMVEQVLEFAGAQSEQRRYTPRPCSADELVRRALVSCRPLDGTDACSVELDMEADLPQVQADPAALQRAIQNLLDNAMKYGGECRWIGVRARAADGPRGREVQITVHDRGPGISPADIPHIWEPFFRGRAAMDAQIRGSGLGLSLVKHIVEAHGGRLSVDSAAERGSAFTLHLPIAPAAQPDAGAVGAAPSGP